MLNLMINEEGTRAVQALCTAYDALPMREAMHINTIIRNIEDARVRVIHFNGDVLHMVCAHDGATQLYSVQQGRYL